MIQEPSMAHEINQNQLRCYGEEGINYFHEEIPNGLNLKKIK
jgi:hypothetical protein